MTTTDIDIDAIRQREQAATKGPWKTGDRFGGRSLGSSVVVLAGNLPPARLDPHRNGRNDAVFIAAARTDVPALLAKVDELTAEREHMELNPTGTAEWLKNRVNELTAALAEARRDRDEYAADNNRVVAQLTAANRRADGLQADLNSATKANTAWANEVAELKARLGEALAAQPDRQIADDGPLDYLIWSHHHQSWWGTNRSGYRANPADAGRYTLAAAEAEMTRGCHCCQVPEVPVAAAKAIGAGDQAIRDAITQATDWAVKAGQANKAYEPATVELPAEAVAR